MYVSSTHMYYNNIHLQKTVTLLLLNLIVNNKYTSLNFVLELINIFPIGNCSYLLKLESVAAH